MDDCVRERVARLKAGLQQAIDIARDAAERVDVSLDDGHDHTDLVEALEKIVGLGSTYDDDLL